MTDIEKRVEKREKSIIKKFFKTYNYYRVYKKGDVLHKHKDRESCEISITVCIGFDADDAWPIYITDNFGNNTSVILNPGDIMIYDGVHLEHWRDEFKGSFQVQAFLHYVDQHGQFAEHKDDKIMRSLNNDLIAQRV